MLRKAGLFEEKDEKKHSHQYRIKEKSREKFVEKLNNIESLLLNLNDPVLLTQIINFLRQLVQAEDFAVYFISRDCLIQHLISLLSNPNPVIKYDIA